MPIFHSHPRVLSLPSVVTLTVALLCIALWPSFLPAARAKAAKTAAELVKDGEPIDLSHARYMQLFKELEEKHHFSRQELDALFRGVTINKRVLELMDRQWEAKPYYQYAPLFITPGNIKKGKQKLAVYKELLDKIEKKLGVDREIVIAIWGIESRYGASQGKYNVFQSLNTLFAAYPRRSTFFRKQLIHLLLLCRENDKDPHSVTGSYAGAFGQTQFIPSSFREYAVSFDGDDKRDVWNSVPDILASIANYLRRYHWQLDAPIYAELGNQLHDDRLVAVLKQGRKGKISWQQLQKLQKISLPPSPDNRKLTIVALELDPNKGGGTRYIAGYPNFQAITAWNHSNRYAMAVTELAEAFVKE